MPAPLCIEDLRERAQKGERFVYCHFYGHTPRSDGKLSNAIFSQFYASPFSVDGQAYNCAEQWMMAGKARLFGDDAVLTQILAAQSPQECKTLGRQVRNYDEAGWQKKRFDLVTFGNLAKFEQNKELGDYLLATGEEILVEAAKNDPIWGIGMHRNDPGADKPLRWLGQNLLGFALIKVRAALRGDLEIVRSEADFNRLSP